MAIEAQQKSIRALIMGDNMSFHIPIYQRSYTWRANAEVEKLLADIREFAEEYKGSGSADYYIGNVILKNQNRGFITERIVIDGQQRITTTILILCAIRDIYNKEIGTVESQHEANVIQRSLYVEDGNVKRIKLNNMEHQKTLDLLLSGETDTISPFDKSTNYWRCYQHIRRRFETMNQPQLQEFAEILDRVKVVSIFLDENQDENAVFESINSAGKPLSGSDLIKNFVFSFKAYRISDQQEKFLTDLYTSKFEELFAEAKDTEDELEAFFREYIAVKTTQKVNNDPKVIYFEFKKWAGSIASENECHSKIRDLIKWATIYRLLKFGAHESINPTLLGYLRASFHTYASLLMDIVDRLADVSQGEVHISDTNQLNKALEKVVVYDAFRFLAGESAKTITRFIPSIPRKLEKNDADYFRDYADAFHELVTTTPEGYRQPSVRLVQKMVNSVNYYKNKKQLIRFLILVENIGKNELISIESGVKGCQVEHIMPQSLTDDWMHISQSTHEQYLHTLGNLSITFDNQNLSNRSFAEKKAVLAAKSHISLNQILLNYTEFSEREIKDRANNLLAKFFGAYNIKWTAIEPLDDKSLDLDGVMSLQAVDVTPQIWLNKTLETGDAEELRGLGNASTWKTICDHLQIVVGADSAHRRLERWIEHNRPFWPSTF